MAEGISMNSLIAFTSNIISELADDIVTKKSSTIVQQRLLSIGKPNLFTGLSPAGRVLISNSGGIVTTSATDITVFENLKGVRSDIQGQIDDIPISLQNSSNTMEQYIQNMADGVSQYHNNVSSALQSKKNALQFDQIQDGVVNKLIRNENYVGNLTVDGDLAASNYDITGAITITGTTTVQETFNTDTIEIVNELNAPALKVVNNVSSNILSINYGTSGNSNKVTLLSNGNLGIGISSPQEKLDVDGNIVVSGTINGITTVELGNLSDVTNNVQQQLDAVGTRISSSTGYVSQTLGTKEPSVLNYVKQTREKLLYSISEMESNVSNYVDTVYDTLATTKQNKLTFGEGLSYDSEDNTLTISTATTLWTENVNTGTISYGNVAIYGDKIEINQKEVATLSLVNQKQDTITGSASNIVLNDLVANKVLVTDVDGKVAASTVDVAQLDYLVGVTEPIQTKIDSILADVVATSNEYRTLAGTNITNISNYTERLGVELEGTVNNLYDTITFGSGLVYDDATKTLSTDGTFVHQGTAVTSDSVWTSNVDFDYINFEQIKIYDDHVTVNDALIATDLDFAQKQDAINFSSGLSYDGTTKTVSVAPGVWQDKGHYIRYKNTRIYNNRMTVGVDDTVDVKKYPPVGLPGTIHTQASGTVRAITNETYGNGGYKSEWSSDSGPDRPSMLFDGNLTLNKPGGHSAYFINGSSAPYCYNSTVGDANYGYAQDTTKYFGTDSENYGEWVSLTLPDRIYMSYIKIYQRSPYPGRSPQIYIIYGTNDNVTWDNIYTEANASYTSFIHVSNTIFPQKSYNKYAILIRKLFGDTRTTTVSGVSSVPLSAAFNFVQIELFGIPDETLYLVSDEFVTDTTDMLAWYKFDGDLTDSSGNGKDLTGGTGTSFVDDKVAGTKSISFPNTQNMNQAVSNTALNLANTSFTISFWCKRTNNGEHDWIISSYLPSSPYNLKLLLIGYESTINKMRFSFYGDDLDTASYATDNSTWTHWTFVYNITTRLKQIYRNGVFETSATASAVINVLPGIYIGNRPDFPTLPYGGKLDDVRIYNRALTSEEVRAVYRVGKPVLYDFYGDTTDMYVWYKFSGTKGIDDSSGNSKDATATGTPVLSETSLSITKDNYLKLPDNIIDHTKDICISFWYRFDNIINFGRLFEFSIYNNVATHSNSIKITREQTTSQLVFLVDGTYRYADFGHSTSGPLIHLTWVIKKDGTWIIYKNGVQIESVERAYPSTQTYIHSYLGKSNWAGEFGIDVSITLKDFRIYNRALTPDEVHTLYEKSSMSSNGTVELHTMKADQLMPAGGSSSAIKIGKHVQMRTIEATTNSLSSRIVNSELDVINTRANPYCMKLQKDLWMDGAGIIWTSDQRIKKEITDIDDDVALQQILTIEPKTYKYIDNLGNASKAGYPVYGFISQQIEEVIPEATKKTARYIPNVYQYCEYNSSNNTIRLPGDFDISRLNTLIADKFSSNYDDMTSNIVVTNDNHLSTRLKVIDENNQETFLQYSMTSNEDGYELQIHNRDFRPIYPGPGSGYAANGYAADGHSSNLFVYGTEINDLTTLDKSYIYTLNTCATQVLSRKVDSLRLTNETLSQYIETLEQRISIIRDYVNASSNSNVV